ncbi:hypothetical protein CLV98_102426 [Dyadobacter jejuensis]|uniref:Outer membrane protein with beta-barrel domain n=1 Tax=Dyadobacter jejuensis TaxID=1082580 RepID=A0A316APT7_9BACT|nr:hypothetical protein [Dyadobacter jejuensis]PWJ59592.1 hypothetical protein CLV98_102426 [Dyadobacter jejuensis]
MRQRPTIITALLLALLSLSTYAQRRTKITDSNDAYKTFTSVGLTTNTNSGILGGAVFRQSTAMNSTLFGKNQYRYIALELVNVKHPKELAEQDFVTGKRLVFGKENFLFVLRPEYGRELTLFNRHEDEGISISAIVAAGPSIGIEKPYMIQYKTSDGRILTEPFDPVKHTSSSQSAGIIGAGSFFQGFGKSKIVPGLHFKTALSFELSAFRENVTGIEIGFLAEAFTRKINIMAYADNRSVYTSGYITLYFGSKKR